MDHTMTVKAARVAIEAILAAIPDDELPEFDRVEFNPSGPTVWWGGRGACLGSAKANGKREPLTYRQGGSWDAIEGEMTYRADLRYFENGDNADGIRLAKKAV